MIRRIFPLIMGAVLLVGLPATEAQANDDELVLRNYFTTGIRDFAFSHSLDPKQTLLTAQKMPDYLNRLAK